MRTLAIVAVSIFSVQVFAATKPSTPAVKVAPVEVTTPAALVSEGVQSIDCTGTRYRGGIRKGHAWVEADDDFKKVPLNQVFDLQANDERVLDKSFVSGWSYWTELTTVSMSAEIK